jgi:hypothetical protein
MRQRLTGRGGLAWVLAIGMVVAAGPARAAVVQFYGIDPGVGPGGANPNSAAAAASFDAAVAATDLITWEDAALPSGVTATPYNMGVDLPSGRINGPQDTVLGYNTTAGGTWFYRIVPTFGIPTAGVQFSFATPINAFGAYYTGIQPGFGTLHVLFDDGTSQDLAVPGDDAGGVAFHGFTTTGAGISLVDVRVVNPNPGLRDMVGIDDIRVRSVPEPGTLGALAMGLAALVAKRRRRR